MNLKTLLVMTGATPEQAQADDAIACDHNGSENCVASQTCLFCRSSYHNGDNQSDLNDCDGDGED